MFISIMAAALAPKGDGATIDASPMVAQYFAIKAEHMDYLLFCRVGRFYKVFAADAQIASRALGLKLTAYGKHTRSAVAMCAVPVERANIVLQKLVALGHRIAVCEQLEEVEAKKLGVTRLINPLEDRAGATVPLMRPLDTAAPTFHRTERGWEVSTRSVARFFSRSHESVMHAVREMRVDGAFVDVDDEGECFFMNRRAFGLLVHDWPNAAQYLQTFDQILAEQRKGGNALVVDLGPCERRAPAETVTRRDH